METYTITSRFWGMDGFQYGQLGEVMVRRDCLTWYRLDNGQPLLDGNIVYK